MAQRTSQGVMDGGSALPSGTAQPALPLAEALGRCNPDQRAPRPALAKEDVLYATRPKPSAQLIRATTSQPGGNLVRHLQPKGPGRSQLCQHRTTGPGNPRLHRSLQPERRTLPLAQARGQECPIAKYYRQLTQLDTRATAERSASI